MTKFKVVHYINQFYAGIGGEEKAPSCVATVSLMRTWIVPKRMY